mmetsp:Transcript_31740/g.36662  ORF Transcript_31740/g.36662 Transcript_31740/m.36662 type:complete len:381 (+) Transcript_31740:38-1180(+)
MTSVVQNLQPQDSQTIVQFNSEQEFQKYMDSNAHRVIVTYKKGVYDVTEFIDSHPGGDDMIKDCNGRDISDLFHSSYPHQHSSSAMRMLTKYKVGEIKDEKKNSDTSDNQSSEAYPQVTQDYIQYKDFRISRKDGFIFQTLGLSKEQYLDFIHHPLHLDECKLFTWKFFEFFTRNKWWYIPIAWLPVIIYFVFCGVTYDYSPRNSYIDNYLRVDSPDFNRVVLLVSFLLGMFFWTLSEYVLHRYLFHLNEVLLFNKWIRWFHFMIHGIHHLIPMDPDRLVFPPPLGYVISISIFAAHNCVFGGNLARILYAGTMFAYVMYDYQHWWLHHGKGGIEYFRDLKRYHNLHHFFDADQGYGITSKLWDFLFGTMIKIKEQKVSK